MKRARKGWAVSDPQTTGGLETLLTTSWLRAQFWRARIWLRGRYAANYFPAWIEQQHGRESWWPR